jgi:soluble lytic murein transglycosylase
MSFDSRKTTIVVILLILAALIVGFYYSVFHIACRLYPLYYVEEIKNNSAQYSLDPYLISTLIYEESKFEPDVVSQKDAIGLVQILPDTANLVAKDLGITNLLRDDLFKPEVNIKFGTYYLKTLLDRYNGDEDLALAAYNAGFGALDKSGKQIENLPLETREFVRRCNETEKIYKKLYPTELGGNSQDKLNFQELAEIVLKKIGRKTSK